MTNKIVRTEPKPYCPSCGGMMILRHRRTDKKPFWGCNSWPDCDGTRDIDEDGLPVYDEIVDEGGPHVSVDGWGDGDMP